MKDIPFDPKAETLGCLIVVEVENKPKHFKILGRFESFEDCEAAYVAWKEGK